jgi:asparagine synthase (glutamine-hydrolysing)
VYESVVPAAVRGVVARDVVPSLPAALQRYARRSFLSMPRRPEAMFLDSFAGVPSYLQQELLEPSVLASNPYSASLDYFTRVNGTSSVLGKLLYTDVKTYLVELLMKQDQMSMSASIESRVPFLDHKLVEFAATLPDRMKLRRFHTKRILREAVKGILPAHILTRPKMGFPVPFAGWIQDGWYGVARDVLLDRRCRDRGIVRPRAVERLLDEHRAGRRAGGDAVWALLNLELWYRTFIDGEGVQTLSAGYARR